MIKNYFYLVAGILAIVFAVTHALNGQNTVLPSLNVGSVTTEVKTTFFYVWHIITAENLLFGITFLIMSVQKNLSRVRFTATVIAVLKIIRLLVIFGGTLLYNASALKNILVDTIAIAVYVSLIFLGTKVKDKQVAV
jgi:hypothetical protein